MDESRPPHGEDSEIDLMFILLYRLGSTPLVRRLVGDQRGQSLTEFALVAPLLFVVLFGVIDFGKAFNYWNDETQLAAVGARLAVVSGGNTSPGGTCTDGSTAPADLASYIQCLSDTRELRNGSSNVTKAKVCITFPDGNAGRGDPVRVTVSTNYNWLPILSSSSGGGLFTLPGLGPKLMAGSATMRLERAWPSASAVASSGATCP
jgi:Flp pilus assembly protein TadG